MTLYSKNILVDADALVALAKTNDSNHEKALNLNTKLQKFKYNFCFSPFTVAEAVTVLSYKTTHNSAKKFLTQVRELHIPVLNLPDKQASLTDLWFFKQNNKGTSFFDCYNMALLEHYSLPSVFSFDKIYKKNGFTLLENFDF